MVMISAQQYGPWAVVTGGGEGTGLSFARELGKAGINLLLVARREGPLNAAADRVRAESGVEVRTLPLDLSQPDMLDRLREATGGLEVGTLVSNVGHTYGSGPFVDWDMEDVKRTIQLGPMCHAILSNHFGAAMAKRGKGAIVLVGSMAGNAGGATIALYSAGKAFAQNLAEGLWAELEPKGVDVVYVVLGATDTPVRAAHGIEDSPDVFIDNPDDVARDTLAQIKDGPVLVRPQLEEVFRMFSTLPRRQAAEAMRQMMTGFQPAGAEADG
jgi:short-subunit dehydrogenase